MMPSDADTDVKKQSFITLDSDLVNTIKESFIIIDSNLVTSILLGL